MNEHAFTPEPQHYEKGWIATYTGRQFYPLDPRPEDIDPVDIAHALSLQTRFTGHCPEPYSVAQHSVLVSLHCDMRDALWGLLHDASEAYICDLSRPAKEALRKAGIAFYDEIEARIMRAVADRFGLTWPVPASVKRADEMLLTTEARQFFRHHKTYPLWHHRPENGFSILESPIRVQPWRQAKAAFLHRFEYLTGETFA